MIHPRTLSIIRAIAASLMFFTLAQLFSVQVVFIVAALLTLLAVARPSPAPVIAFWTRMIKRTSDPVPRPA